MKKFSIFALAAIFFAACATDQTVDLRPADAPETIYASFDESNADSRVYVEQDTHLCWTAGDEISYFPGVTFNMQYRFKGETGATNGAFQKMTFDPVTGIDLQCNYAIYPFAETTEIAADGTIAYHFPSVQHYAENSFGLGANVMVAATKDVDDSVLRFRNAGGYLKLQLYGSDEVVKSITLKGNNNEKIAGVATITMAYGDVPVVAMSDDATSSVSIDCGDGVALSTSAENPTSFWFVLPEVTFEKGFAITVANANGELFEKVTSNEVVITRNEIQPMAAIEVEFASAGPASNEIWYTSSDGKIVTPYRTGAFGVSIKSNVYENGKGVITFDGNVTSIGYDAFFERTTLTSVKIPNSVLSIGHEAFSGCRNMTSVDIPNGVTSIGDEAFYDCSSIIHMYIPESVVSLGDEAFRCCSGTLFIDCNIPNSSYDEEDDNYPIFFLAHFTEIVVGDRVTSLGSNAFRSCSKLETLTLGENITNIGSCALTGCVKLSKIYSRYASEDNRCLIIDGALTAFAPADLTEYTIPDGVTSIKNTAFYKCSSLTNVTIPDSVTEIGSYAFEDCNNLISVYCKAKTPPTLGVDAFRNNAVNRKIYIPYNSAEQYNTATNWRDIMLTAYDFENNKVYEVEQNPITYDWYTSVTDGVYEIDAPEELVALSKLTNGDVDALSAVGAESSINFASKIINLTADIDLSNYCSPLAGNWIPIGNFGGTFNGNNHIISNLFIKTTGSAGLFALLGGATIKDLTVQGDITCTSAKYVGGIVASASFSLFENCKSEVNVLTSTTNMGTCVGGICGWSSENKFVACQSTGNVLDEIEEWEWHNYVGGIVGYAASKTIFVACCKLSGSVIEANYQSYTGVGGILGCLVSTSAATIRSCYTSISIRGREPGYITNTGRIRLSYANIADCYYLGDTYKGIGTDKYGNNYSYDLGTARSTDIAAEIIIMNEGIDEWNTENPDCICDYKYELDENNVPKLVK